MTQTADQFMQDLFEYEYCAECGGDAQHHTAVLVAGNWFAWCDYPPTPKTDWKHHPIVLAFRAKADNGEI